ncbi:Carboxypeptidase [Forsythia ovata]|uniref:Carboxypeptidase n=1 Tax=Forsythia ovata TaxID=205694 RepID=A0ABD1U6X1_9LAMI
MENFLNKQPVRDALGVGDIDFVSCSSAVYDAMVTDWMRNLEVGIPTLLEDGIKLLVYAGEYDLICNWLGKILQSISKDQLAIRSMERIMSLELLSSCWTNSCMKCHNLRKNRLL